MTKSRDPLINIYLSEQWCIHGGPRSRPAREELRDRLIPVVIQAFGSIESSLDVLLKESPCSNGHRIETLIGAYKLFFLRLRREAIEARDQAAEQGFADLLGQFDELDEYEKNLFGLAKPQDNERIYATLRTSVCNLPTFRPMASTALNAFQKDASERPLGDNPFPSNHPGNEAFEEATWNAKEAINGLKSELLQTLSKPPFDFIQSILTYRLSVFSVCANAALLIVVNEKTAKAYEGWIDAFATIMLEETLQKGQLQDPNASPESPPLFRAEMLPQITVDLHLQLMRVVAHYKKEAAKRVLLVRQERLKAFSGSSDDQQIVGSASPRDVSVDAEGEKTVAQASPRVAAKLGQSDPTAVSASEGAIWQSDVTPSLAALLNEAQKLADHPRLRKMVAAVIRYNWYFKELRALRVAAQKYQTPDLLKKQFPGFEVWDALDGDDANDIAAGSFDPGRFSWALVKRLNNLKGKDDRTLKNYRKALRDAGISIPRR